MHTITWQDFEKIDIRMKTIVRASSQAIKSKIYIGILFFINYPLHSMLESSFLDNYELRAAADRFFTDLYRGDVSEVEHWLNSKRVDINVVNNAGDTPLMIASNQKCSKMVEMLLAHRADANFVAQDGTNPLLRALKKGSEEIVRILLPFTIDINKQDASGNTALMYATINQNKNVIVYLLNADAKIDIKNKQQKTFKDNLNQEPKLAQDPEIRKALAAYEERRKAKQQALQEHLPKDLANLALECL